MIVLATVIGMGDAGEIPQKQFEIEEVYTPKFAHKLPSVKFRVDEIYKGLLSQPVFFVAGWLNDYKGKNAEAPPYQQVREGGQYGSCFALDYAMDKSFLLFLRHGSPYWAALAPVNEEVSGPDDSWVWWVRGVIEAQKNSDCVTHRKNQDIIESPKKHGQP